MIKETKKELFTITSIVGLVVLIFLVILLFFKINTIVNTHVPPLHEQWELFYTDIEKDNLVEHGHGYITKYIVDGNKVTFYFVDIETKKHRVVTLSKEDTATIWVTENRNVIWSLGNE